MLESLIQARLGVDVSQVHLIGHSLGAHTAGYIHRKPSKTTCTVFYLINTNIYLFRIRRAECSESWTHYR